MQLTPRQMQIFQTIVEDYINFAEPVGSRTISKKLATPVSSATIRNEMSDLEDMGLITQQHLSSGRVPTQKGMRFYVDCILELSRLSDEETEKIDRIKEEYARKKQHIRDLMKDISKTMAEAADYPSLVIAPKISAEKFKKIQFLLIDNANIIVTLVTRGGFVHHFSLGLDFAASQDKLDYISSSFNRLPGGFSVGEVGKAISSEFGLSAEQERAVIESITTVEDDNADDRIILNGTEIIFRKPEFQNSEKLKLFIDIVNNKEKLIKLLSGRDTANLRNNALVLIGDEVFDFAQLDLGIVASEYRDADSAPGMLGIIGPSRMEYSRVISIVREIASRMSNILGEN